MYSITITDVWIFLNIIVILGIVGTLAPISWAFLLKISPDKTPIWLEEAQISEEQKQRVLKHHKLIAGTLKYWKNQAAAHERLFIARKVWSIFASVTLPAFVQLYDKSDYALSFITIFTMFSGFIVLLAYAFKSEEKHRGFRQYESEYYDIARRLINLPAETEEQLKKQVDEFILLAEKIRKAARKVETGDTLSAIDQ
ncbi:MAG: hypothetical protein ACRBBN_05755 [Methyloligellaceae bacterium]